MAYRALLIIGLLVMGLLGCAKGGDAPADQKQGAAATSGDPAATEEATPGGRKLRSEIPLRVFAVNSFSAALPALANRYRESYNGKELAITFGTPDDLLRQIRDSQAADLLILDDPDLVRKLKEEKLIEHASVLAAAQLVVITNAEKPILLSVAEDLRKPEIKTIGVPASTTAAGKASMAYLGDQTLLNVLQPRLKEYPTVAEVVKAVGSGEVTVGFAYASAVRGRKQVKSTLACGLDAPPEFIAMPVSGSQNEGNAEEFVTILQDEASKKALVTAGFIDSASRVIY